MESLGVQRRVQFAVLLQLAENAAVDRETTARMCPDADVRDLAAALVHLLAQGAIEGPTWLGKSLVGWAETGFLSLTGLGRQRLDEDDV